VCCAPDTAIGRADPFSLIQDGAFEEGAELHGVSGTELTAWGAQAAQGSLAGAIRMIAQFSRCTTASGMPPGATMPSQVEEMELGDPASPAVGNSGSSGLRRAPLATRPFRRPVWTFWI
jgi:hypothetical protein